MAVTYLMTIHLKNITIKHFALSWQTIATYQYYVLNLYTYLPTYVQIAVVKSFECRYKQIQQEHTYLTTICFCT